MCTGTVVWSSSITELNKIDLECTQKALAKVALKNTYTDYETGLLKPYLEKLESRRQTRCLNWAKK